MKASISKKRNSGFTLIEVLLYIALTTTMVVILGNIGIDAIYAKAKGETLQEVAYNSHFIGAHIESIIYEADSINLPATGSTSTLLSLAYSDSTRDPTLLYVATGTLYIKEGAETEQPITTQTIEIDDFSTLNISTNGATESVRLNFFIKSQQQRANGSPVVSEEFFITRNLR